MSLFRFNFFAVSLCSLLVLTSCSGTGDVVSGGADDSQVDDGDREEASENCDGACDTESESQSPGGDPTDNDPDGSDHEGDGEAVTATCGDGYCHPTEGCEDCPSDCGGCPDGALTFPVRAAFYYPWYPQTWTVDGHHVFYDVELGYYSSDDLKIIDEHIKMMEYAHIDVAIASWWGPDAFTNTRIPLLLERTEALGSPLKWAFYYEDEGFGDPSPATLAADLDYLKQTYGDSPALAKIDGKPVIFVYNADDKDCEVADRWAAANDGDWYVSLKIFNGFAGCSQQPDTWHQYGPDAPAQQHAGYSYVIAPGFWRADQGAPLLKRNIERFYQNVRDMVASGEPWQLITTFNEWGEGTAVEPAAQWASDSGFGQYLDALHSHGVQGSVPSDSDTVEEDSDVGDDGKEFFSIGVMPDTQYLVNDGGTCKKEGLRGMFDYFVERESQLNLEMVVHVGDLTQGVVGDLHPEEWDGIPEHWERFMEGYSVLKNRNIPFVPCRGNHDERDFYTKYFPVSDYQDKPFFGDNKNQMYNAYYLTSAAGQDLIILTLDYYAGAYPEWLIEWANGVLQSHSDRIAIVVTHDFRKILDSVIKKNDNVQMAIMGHSSKDTHWTQTSVGGRTQHVFVFDYQDAGSNDCAGAIVKTFTFYPSKKVVEMRTHSVYEKQDLTANNCSSSPTTGGYICQKFDFSFE